MVTSNREADTTTIVLLPNRSASWEETRLLVLLICGTALAIGVFWAVAGAWAVLPFSGLEAALVAYVFYRVSQATYRRQVITCSPQAVRVQFGTHFPQRTWLLERARAHVATTDPRHPLDPIGLRLVDANHSIEIGAFLNHTDKAAALAELKRAGLHVRSSNDNGALDS